MNLFLKTSLFVVAKLKKVEIIINVNTRRYFNVDSTFFERLHGRQIDIGTAFCAYWHKTEI